MIIPPPDPTKVRQISFLEAVEDENGDLRVHYILQQALKKYPNDYYRWQVLPESAFFLPGFKSEAAKFESDKAHYTETGELPEDC